MMKIESITIFGNNFNIINTDRLIDIYISVHNHLHFSTVCVCMYARACVYNDVNRLDQYIDFGVD